MEDYIRKIFEGEAPCDKCEQALDCKESELACRAFSYYVRKGTFEQHTVRMPTHHLYMLIFKDDDTALKNYLKSVQTKGGQDVLFE
jgi:hypothetical protein